MTSQALEAAARHRPTPVTRHDSAAERLHEPEFHPLDGPVTEAFDCGRDDQTRFLLESAWEHQRAGFSTTYLMLFKGMLAGYVTLAMSEAQLAAEERPEGAPFARLPAVKLAQMGVAAAFQGQGLGQDLVAHAISVALAAAETVGCTYLVLDAVPERAAWYRDKFGFVENTQAQRQRRQDAQRYKRDPDAVPVSMRFDLRRPGERELTALRRPARPRGDARSSAGTGAPTADAGNADAGTGAGPMAAARGGARAVLTAISAVGSFLVYRLLMPRKRDTRGGPPG